MGMKRALTVSLFALTCGTAFAATINCPGVGQIEIRGKVASITYASEMNLGFTADQAKFLWQDDTDTFFQFNHWGAEVEIPNDLIDGKVTAGNVSFALAEEAGFAVRCATSSP